MVIEFPNGFRHIIVIANYRTGSTAFCDIVANTTGLLNVDEIFHRAVDKTTYKKYHDHGCVIKIMPDQFDHPAVDSLLQTSWIIGITRRDIVAQIASFYICHMTGQWHNLKNTSTKNYNVPIDKDELENQVRYIVDMNSKYQILSEQYCTQQYYYEDINTKMTNSKFTVFHKPFNYRDICSMVVEILMSCVNQKAIFAAEQSEFFKRHYLSNWHNRGIMTREIDVIREQEGW